MEPTGTLDAALAHTQRLLDTDPMLAAEQAGEILKVVPEHPLGMLYLGMAQRALGGLDAAMSLLQRLTLVQPKWALAHYELGLALGDGGQDEAAMVAWRRAVELKPNMPDAWRAIGDSLFLGGDVAGADAAYAQQIKASTQDPRLLIAASALVDGRIAQAELALRTHLKQHPTDVAAIRMLAEVAARLGRNADAEVLLERCVELAPSFDSARHNYALILNRQHKPAVALRQIESLLVKEPNNPGYQNLKAVVLARIGKYSECIDIYADLLANHPQQAKIWMSYGHALSTAGRETDSVAAYRQCIKLAPEFGEAYWSLANLKTFRFTAAELSGMRLQLARTDLSEENRFHFHFALAKALEDERNFAEAFGHFSKGNQQRRAGVAYSAANTTDIVVKSKRLFSSDFFRNRAFFGASASDPIFIVGLPRAGSTLIEQILASHSMVEGTMELSDIGDIFRILRDKKAESQASDDLAGLGNLGDKELRALGDQYIEQTRVYRQTQKPHFIDKLPNNFLHIGLIQLILPNSKIIDARRHPMACCFSGFKQHFARGQNYSYSLEEIGNYYCDYVELMAHFDHVLPGKVHRVIYENMIDDTENQIRNLLAYCGLPFEESCLRFHENTRAVKTASAQQVRKPIFREGLDHWRNFEPWLDPLKVALGKVVDLYPEVPKF